MAAMLHDHCAAAKLLSFLWTSLSTLPVNGFRFWKKTIKTKWDEEVTVSVTMIGKAGNVDCAVSCGKIFTNMRVGLAVLAGICAGVKEKVSIGDVICPEGIIDYEGGRLTPDGIEKRPDPNPLERNIEREIAYFRPNVKIWRRDIKTNVKKLAKYEDIPKLRELTPQYHRDIILSGEKLLADGKLPKMRKDYDERVRGAEMEGSGFAKACKERDLNWLVFRGVSDYGDPDKPETEIWQTTAATCAMTTVFDYIQRVYRKPEALEF